MASAYEALIRRVDALTAWPRLRHAEDVFFQRPPRRRDEVAAKFYFTLSVPLWARRGVDEEHLAPFLAMLEQLEAPRRALDVGTGTGNSAAVLAERFGDSEIVGLDGSRAMVRAAVTRHRAPNLRFVRADWRRIPFDDGYFDLVTMLNALPEPGETARVCQEGGTMGIANAYFPVFDDHRREFLKQFGFRCFLTGQVGDGSWMLFRRSSAT